MLNWKHHPRHGFRFSTVDGLAILVCAAATFYGWEYVGNVAWLFPFVLGHFFLFCNVFRVPRVPELIWAGSFVTLATVCAIADVSLVWAMGLVLPVTAAVIVYAIRRPDYHGVGSRRTS